MHRAPEMTAESAQRSANLTDVVAVRGGGIPLDVCLSLSWILTPEVVDGRRFVDIYTGDYRCKNYLGGRFAMVERLKKLRDASVNELMLGLTAEEDPNDDSSPRTENKRHRPKRELIDKLPSIIEVDVVTRRGVEATVKVIPSWRERGVLQIELTQEKDGPTARSTTGGGASRVCPSYRATRCDLG